MMHLRYIPRLDRTVAAPDLTLFLPLLSLFGCAPPPTLFECAPPLTILL
jgi:hypothetical protein